MGAVSVFVQKHPPTKKQFFPEKKQPQKAPTGSSAVPRLTRSIPYGTPPAPLQRLARFYTCLLTPSNFISYRKSPLAGAVGPAFLR